MNVLVLGVGNILLSDEGIGVHVVEALQARYRLPAGLEIIDGGTSGMDLLDSIANRDHLVIVDAVHTGAEPGTLVELTGEDVPAFFLSKISPHQLGLSDVLATAALTGETPRDITLIGVVPESMETGLEMSPRIQAMLEPTLLVLLRHLNRLGLHPEPRHPDWYRRNGTEG